MSFDAGDKPRRYMLRETALVQATSTELVELGLRFVGFGMLDSLADFERFGEPALRQIALAEPKMGHAAELRREASVPDSYGSAKR